jgi:hypothetical protein
MLWHQERLYVAVPTGSASFNTRVLVYDTQHQSWTLYDLAAAALASFRADDRPSLHFGYSTGDRRVGRLITGRHADRDDVPIRSWWRSGWSDYGSSQVKTMREAKLWGSGAVTVSFSVDFNRTLRTAIPALFAFDAAWPTGGPWNSWLAGNHFKWPGAGQISGLLVRYATRGTVFSTQFANHPAAQSWSVHRVARHLREIREPSVL